MKKTSKILLPLLLVGLTGCSWGMSPSEASSAFDEAASEQALNTFLANLLDDNCLVVEEGLRNASLAFYGPQALYLDYANPGESDFGYLYDRLKNDCLRYRKKEDGSLAIEAFVAPGTGKLPVPFFPSDLAKPALKSLYVPTKTPYLYSFETSGLGYYLIQDFFATAYVGAAEGSQEALLEQVETVRLKLASDGSSGTFSFRFTDRSYFLSLTFEALGKTLDPAVNAYLAAPTSLQAPSAFSSRFLALEETLYGSYNTTLIPFPQASIRSERYYEDPVAPRPIFRLWAQGSASDYSLRQTYAQQLLDQGYTLIDSYNDGETMEDCEVYSHPLLDGLGEPTGSFARLTLGMNLSASFPSLSFKAARYTPPTTKTYPDLVNANATIAAYNALSYPSFPLLPEEATLSSASLTEATEGVRGDDQSEFDFRQFRRLFRIEVRGRDDASFVLCMILA